MRIEHLFLYGTLMPSQPAWPVVAAVAVEHHPDEVRAVLWDTGHGYPALELRDGPAVPGTVVRLAGDGLERTLGRLDDYEGLGPDRYRRSEVTTVGGLRCWTYEWVGSLRGFREVAGGWAGWVASGSASSRNP